VCHEDRSTVTVDALATKMPRDRVKSSPLIMHMSAGPLDHVATVSLLRQLLEVQLWL
jgi:hypothetical protein